MNEITKKTVDTMAEFTHELNLKHPEDVIAVCVQTLNVNNPNFLKGLGFDIQPESVRAVLSAHYHANTLELAMKELAKRLMVFVEFVLFRDTYEENPGISFSDAIQDLRNILEGYFYLVGCVVDDAAQSQAIIDLLKGFERLELEEVLKQGFSGGKTSDEKPFSH